MLVKTRVLQLMLLANPKSHSLTGLLQNKISVINKEQSALDAAISSNENVLGLHVPMNDSETGFRLHYLMQLTLATYNLFLWRYCNA